MGCFSTKKTAANFLTVQLKFLQKFLYQFSEGYSIQLQKLTTLINSTLIQSVRNFVNCFDSKTTHIVRKISSAASTEKFEKFSKK